MKKIVFVVLIICLVVGCKDKSKNSDPTPNGGNETPTGSLYLHLHNYIDVTEVDAYNIVYTTSGGRKIILTKAQFYLSDFELVKLDGSIYKVSGSYILKIQENQVYKIGDVPVGNYKSIRFNVGLNATKNASSPAANSTSVLNKPEMWFSSTAQPDGFVYMNLSGKIDTTVAADGLEADMVPFDYKIGTTAHFPKVSMPIQNFTITEGAIEYLHTYADVSKMFTGIDLLTQSNLTMNTKAENGNSLATILSSNMATLFSYE